MSEHIDWSKAPEGYPLWLEDLNKSVIDQSGWHCDDGDRYSDVSGRFWLKSSSASYCVHERPTTPSWSGEGLPPAGVVCQFLRLDDCQKETLEDGAHVKIIAHYDGMNGQRVAAFTYDHRCGRDVESAISDCFLPIRTPEQIAADEREAAILDMERICRSGDFGSGGLAALYDAGYRKP